MNEFLTYRAETLHAISLTVIVFNLNIYAVWTFLYIHNRLHRDSSMYINDMLPRNIDVRTRSKKHGLSTLQKEERRRTIFCSFMCQIMEQITLRTSQEKICFMLKLIRNYLSWLDVIGSSWTVGTKERENVKIVLQLKYSWQHLRWILPSINRVFYFQC